MIFSTWDQYKDIYLQGRPKVISEAEFAFWADQASSEINFRKVDLPPEKITDNLIKCTCAVAEILFSSNAAQGSLKRRGKSSEKVGDASASYFDPNVLRQQTAAAIRVEVCRWLRNTELHNLFVYRGI